MPSRGVGAAELVSNPLWLNGPDWLRIPGHLPMTSDAHLTPPQKCWQELRVRKKAEKSGHTLLTTPTGGPRIGELIDCKRFSSFRRLLSVTSVVLKFVSIIRARLQNTSEVSITDPDDVEQSRIYWLREIQSRLGDHEKFSLWSRQLDLSLDDSQLWRCGGRMKRSDLPLAAQNPFTSDTMSYP